MAYRRKQGPADDRRSSYPQDSASSYSYTSIKSVNEPKLGLWETLARKAKGILDEDRVAHKFEDFRKDQPRSNTGSSNGTQAPQSRWSFENNWKTGEAASQIRPEALSASVNQLSGRIRNALEEGLTIVDNKTSSIIEETKKIQIRRKPASSSSYMPNSVVDTLSTPNLSLDQAESAAQETQLKASRNRCAQLEDENKILRETKQKGSKTEEDDELIRVQLETLLSEKSRLAQENSTYARENRFLREIVEFHQFTTNDVVSLDDGDVEDGDPEEDINLIYTGNMLAVIEENSAHEELSHVPSRPESPNLSPTEQSSPESSNSCSVAGSPNNASKPNASASDTA
ncbi:uncharacterized protein LOC133905542 isoform X2 [Phragmites australis]|uniref:uncharacterized protein LOC133905542 isoform X2 n=1 Tax=Phragmites australis TaxID=29695 RepID=UPI002D765BA7|nr:uncharacterized protein LOC133905542 isoform X2 [Phragmites australis]